jgi:hypothetical protein
MCEQPNYYAILPAFVRYDKDLPANARLLYGELTALTNKKGYCFASNNYFAPLYGVTPQAISKWIKILEKKGYIKIEYIYENGAITERCIHLKEAAQVIANNKTSENENENNYEAEDERTQDKTSDSDNTAGVSTTVDTYQRQVEGVSTQRLEGYQRQVEENTTRVNITRLNENDKYASLQLAKKLLSLHRKLDSNFACSDLQLEYWSDCIIALHKTESRTYDEIDSVIDFAKSNKFWQTIINSGNALQKNYTTLFLQMKNLQMKKSVSQKNNKAKFSDNSLPDVFKKSILAEASEIEKEKFLRKSIF